MALELPEALELAEEPVPEALDELDELAPALAPLVATTAVDPPEVDELVEALELLLEALELAEEFSLAEAAEPVLLEAATTAVLPPEVALDVLELASDCFTVELVEVEAS